MASFTDQIPTFNPYISQLPVDAMVKVGMEKQRRYDEGVQKIQAEIDKVGGLSIAKDSDKAYLQSKINQLGNNLKTFMASDFSDYQLVNSVAGMTGQIINDENGFLYKIKDVVTLSKIISQVFFGEKKIKTEHP